MNKTKPINPLQMISGTAPIQPLSEFKNQFLSPTKKSQLFQGFSQPKARSNVIKINKCKLPADFFPKSSSIQKRLPNFKLHLKQSSGEAPFQKQRRAESQRLHVSPQKTSFFGFFDNNQVNQLIGHRGINGVSSSSKKIQFINKRKFQTRQDHKRQRDNSQMKRRFTPGTNTYHPLRSDLLLDLFPATYDQQMTEIITSNSSSRVAKFSPRKQRRTRQQKQQPVIDPQKSDQKNQKITNSILFKQQQNQNQNIFNKNANNHDFLVRNNSNKQKNLINLKNIQKGNQMLSSNKLDYTFSNSQTIDLHNMTFFNAKSTYLPPIKK